MLSQAASVHYNNAECIDALSKTETDWEQVLPKRSVFPQMLPIEEKDETCQVTLATEEGKLSYNIFKLKHVQ